jgi:hypothetical protein
VKLQFIGIDPNTSSGNCPTVWFDKDTDEIVIQGWKADEAMTAECLKAGPIPDHEAVVRLPARMAGILREACDVATGPAVL